VKLTNWIPLVIFATTLSITGFVAKNVNAQAAGTNTAATTATRPPVPYQVAVVDIAQLIKYHPDFESRQKGLQELAQQKDKEFSARKTEIEQRRATLAAHNYQPGTKEHDDYVSEITMKGTEFDKDLKLTQRKLVTENSKILYEIYKEVQEEIAVVAKGYKIAQVMDYRSIEAAPNEPQSVAAMLEQNLIWYDDALDISQAIMNRLYEKRGRQKDTVNLKTARAKEKEEAKQAAAPKVPPVAGAVNPSFGSAANNPAGSSVVPR
jgi:Skp family chaperone for outer membrane proteins